MERNDFSSEGATPGSVGGSADTGFGNTGNTSGSQGYAAGTTANADTSAPSQPASSAGFADRARDFAGTAKEKAADVGSTVRQRAGTLKDSLADVLDSGADRLRQRGGAQSGQSGQLAVATDIGSTPAQADARVTQVTTRVAGGMEATADWLRETDLDAMKVGIERQVKDHPGRTLLVAVGLGYLLGKAFRK
jgi:hypothetical protein